MVLDSHSVRVAAAAPSAGANAEEEMAVDDETAHNDDQSEEDEEEEGDEQPADRVASVSNAITVILPLAVLPRHHAFACTVAALRSSEGPLVFSSLAPVAAGDPVHLAVGRGPNNAELMVRRGRIANARHTPNPFDALRFPFPAQIPLTHAKLALLQRNGLEDDIRARSHLLRGHGPLPSKLIDTLRVIFLADDAVERLLLVGAEGAKLPLPTDVDAQVAALVAGSLSSLLAPETASGASAGVGKLRHRLQRAQDYALAQRAIVEHNLAQLARWPTLPVT
jgi:hypothetical protein